MNNDLIVALAPIITLGAWTWYVSKQLDDARQTIMEMNDTMMVMAEECVALGSKKVKLVKNEEVQ